MDKNAARPDLPDEPVPTVLYGQVKYIVHVVLEKDRSLKVKEDTHALLGMVQWCQDAEGDAAMEPIWYKKLGVSQAVNISTIQCGVGRVETRGRFGIIDLNYGCATTVFINPDGEEEGSDQE